MQIFESKSERNEALRIGLTVAICMMLGKVLDFNSTVYLALYPCIIMTKCKDFSWQGLFRTLYPTLLAACAALVVIELFSQHPFVVWTISLFFFDYKRRQVINPAKAGAMLMPTFNWILIVVFAQHTNYDMPMRIHEIFLSMAITIIAAKIMVTVFPVEKKGAPPKFTVTPVTFEHRIISLGLIGGGLAFLMIVDVISATFCMVPVIAAATQATRNNFINVVKHRFVTQVGGCALATVFTLLLAGHQSTLSYYFIALSSLAILVSVSMVKAQHSGKDVHSDALLGTMLPIQLYITGSELGLESTLLRTWELSLTMFILFSFYYLTHSGNNNNVVSNIS